MSSIGFSGEPALWVAVIVAALDVAIAFGMPITVDQKTSLIALADAVVAIIGGIVIRQNVTPNVVVNALVDAQVMEALSRLHAAGPAPASQRD